VKVASVSELRASLGRYLAYVEQGEEIVVTQRGKAVAKIEPFSMAGEDAEHRLDLARRGIIRLGRGPVSKKFLDRCKVQDPEGLVLNALLEERGSGR